MQWCLQRLPVQTCWFLSVHIWLHFGNPGWYFFFLLLFNVETFKSCHFKYSFVSCYSDKLLSSVTLRKETCTLFYESKVADILNLLKPWDVGLLLSVARDVHAQHRQNQALEALLNQAPGFELNLFAKEPLKKHCYNVNESVSQFGIEFVTVPQN